MEPRDGRRADPQDLGKQRAKRQGARQRATAFESNDGRIGGLLGSGGRVVAADGEQLHPPFYGNISPYFFF